MACEFCKHYWAAETRLPAERSAKGKVTVPAKRLCRAMGKFVSAKDEDCAKIEVTSTFWCDKRGCMVDHKSCLAIQVNREKLGIFPECENCAQGRNLKETIKGRVFLTKRRQK